MAGAEGVAEEVALVAGVGAVMERMVLTEINLRNA
jgi:hypothetical protein